MQKHVLVKKHPLTDLPARSLFWGGDQHFHHISAILSVNSYQKHTSKISKNQQKSMKIIGNHKKSTKINKNQQNPGNNPEKSTKN